MKSPIFVRSLSEKERERLQAGLRSKDAFTLRRSQMLLASSRREEVPQIAKNLGCGQQTVRDAIHHLNEKRVAEVVVMCATYAWSYDDRKARTCQPNKERFSPQE